MPLPSLVGWGGAFTLWVFAMGAIAVWVLEHGKMVLAWSILLTAFALFVSSVRSSTMFTRVGGAIDTVVSGCADAAALVPQSVANINRAIGDALDESNGFGQLIFYLSGLDTLQSMFTFIAAQISAIITGVVAVGSSALSLAGIAWLLKRSQRWIVAISGGRLNGSQVID